MDITAVIPVRAGSSRVVGKNIRKFADSSLLEIKIEQLKKVKEVSKILVSSDSEKMLEIAKAHNVDISKRPVEYCDEKSKTFNEVVEYIAGNEVSTEYMMWTPCVCPLINEKHFTDAINAYINQQNTKDDRNGVISATLIKEYLYNENGPINFSKEKHVRSQDLPNWYYIINGFYIARREEMYKWKYFYGDNPMIYPIDKKFSIDIDDNTDFEIAEFLYYKKKGLIL